MTGKPNFTSRPKQTASEADIEDFLRRRVKDELHGRAFKWASPGSTGVPDRIVLLPGGRVVFIELKAPGKKPSEKQKFMHALIRALGFTVIGCMDSKDAVEKFITAEAHLQAERGARSFEE